MKEPKKIFILLGHSDKETFSGSIADNYERGAKEAGHEVHRLNIGELQFDPILHKGYKEIQKLEPDLLKIQDEWNWCDHIVIIYPNWWNTMPAILKGMFDRMFLPGFAFKFDVHKKKVKQLLCGKSARVFITAGTHSGFQTWCNVGDYSNEIKNGILKFSGHKPVRVKTFGPAEKVSDQTRGEWLGDVFSMGKRAN